MITKSKKFLSTKSMKMKKFLKSSVKPVIRSKSGVILGLPKKNISAKSRKLFLKWKKISNVFYFLVNLNVFKWFLHIKTVISFISNLRSSVVNDVQVYLLDHLYLYLNTLISNYIIFIKFINKKVHFFSKREITKHLKKYKISSKFITKFNKLNHDIYFIVKNLNPLKTVIYYSYILYLNHLKILFCYLIVKWQCITKISSSVVLYWWNLFYKLHVYFYSFIYVNASKCFWNIIKWRPFFINSYSITLSTYDILRMRSSFVLAYKYLDFLKSYNEERSIDHLHFIKQNNIRDVFLNKLKFVKRPLKLIRNSIYDKKCYPFISILFFKKYLDILHIWFFNNSYSLKFQNIHRNTFIMYIKHLNLSFFSKYLSWINKSKRIVLTLNVNIVKNNLFYTLISNSGNTLATLSTGLFYALPRNRTIKRNPFKKSIAYLAFEMFSLIFYNKVLFPLQHYKWDRKLEFFKGTSPKNGDLEWKKKGNKRFFNKRQRVYFIFKFSRYKHAFPGLGKNMISLLGNKNNKKLYEFVGLYKSYPRIHNGLSKKRPRRL